VDDAVRPEDDFAGHICISNAEENVVGIFRHLARCMAEEAFLFGRQLAGFTGGVRPQRHFVSGAKKVAGHRVAHESQSQESKFCHRE